MSNVVTVPSTWRNRETSEEVQAYWRSSELVSYAKDEPVEVRTVRTERIFKFLQDFEEIQDEQVQGW